jgi:hypothetical protein
MRKNVTEEQGQSKPDLVTRVGQLSPERRQLLDLLLLSEPGLVGPDTPILPRRPGLDRVLASLAQQRLWLQKQLQPGNPAYTIAIAVRLEGPLNVEALKYAFDAIAARHESLRTSFQHEDGQLFQVIHPPRPIDVTVEEMVGASDSEIRQRSIDEVRISFDLSRAPLWRTALLHVGRESYVFLLTLDHIVADEWSIEILIRELEGLYGSRLTGDNPHLPEIKIQYADFSEWQHQWLKGELLHSQIDFWRQHLNPLPPPVQLGSGDEAIENGTIGARYAFWIEEELSSRLNVLARDQNVTLFMLLLAAYESLIAWHAEQEQFTVGTDVAGRDRPEIEPLIAFFVNQLVLRADLTGNPSFVHHLARVREAVLLAYSYQSVPFQYVVDALRPKRRDGRLSTLFRTKFVLHDRQFQPLHLGLATLTPLEIDPGACKFDLLLNMRQDGSRLKATFEYHTGLFDDHSINGLSNQFGELLRQIVQNPHASQTELVGGLALIDARRLDERRVVQRRHEAELRVTRRRVLQGEHDG